MDTKKVMELFNQNQRLAHWTVSKYFPKLLGDEDIHQEALVGLYKACVRYEENRGRFTTFAVTVVRNEINMFLRIENRYRRLASTSLDSPIPGTDGELVLGDMVPDTSQGVDHLSFEGFYKFVESLDGRYKKLLQLRLQGLTQAEAGKELGLCQAQCSRDLRKLRKMYLEWSGKL